MILDTFKHYLNAIRGMGYYIKHQIISAVFLFLVQTNFFFVTTPRKIVKISPVGGFFQLVFYPILCESCRLRSMQPIYILCQNFIGFLLASNSIHKKCLLKSPQKFSFDIFPHKNFALTYCEIKIHFDIYGIENVRSVIRGLEFVFCDFFPCRSLSLPLK